MTPWLDSGWTVSARQRSQSEVQVVSNVVAEIAGSELPNEWVLLGVRTSIRGISALAHRTMNRPALAVLPPAG